MYERFTGHMHEHLRSSENSEIDLHVNIRKDDINKINMNIKSKKDTRIEHRLGTVGENWRD